MGGEGRKKALEEGVLWYTLCGRKKSLVSARKRKIWKKKIEDGQDGRRRERKRERLIEVELKEEGRGAKERKESN